MVAVVFQSIFRAEIYQNNIFYFFKLFLRSAHQNDLKYKKKIEIILQKPFPSFVFPTFNGYKLRVSWAKTKET
jgi:hypothetical protein